MTGPTHLAPAGADQPGVTRAEQIAAAMDTICLKHVGARNLAGRLLHQSCPEIRDLPASPDIVIVCHNGGGSVVERWYDGGYSAVRAAPGKISVVPDRHPTAWRMPKPVEVLQLYIPALAIARIAERGFDVDPARVEIVAALSEDDPISSALAQAALLSLEEDADRDDLFLDALGDAVAIHLLRKHAVLPPAARRLGEHPGALSAERLRRLCDYVEAHLGGELRLKELAQTACLSTFHLSRCFRQATGVTLHAYVMNRRIDRARRLLADGKLSLAETAYECGFASQSHFTAAFKKRVGATPGEFRRRHRA